MAGRSVVGQILLNPDLLALVFRVDVATEAIIEALLRLKVVSKDWHAVISCVVVDKKWLGAFCLSADDFVQKITQLVSEKDACLERKQINARYYVDQIFAHMFSENAQYEALNSFGIIVGQACMTEEVCTRSIAVVNMAMRVHASVSRVQKMACAVVHILSKNELNKEALVESGALSLVLRAGNGFGGCAYMAGSIISVLNEITFSNVTNDEVTARMHVVVAVGAIPMVMRWMQADRDTSELASFTDCCCFIRTCARWHATKLVHAGAHENIFGFMAKFPDKPWLQRRGMSTLKLLVHFGDEDAIDFFGDSHGIGAVFAGMDMTQQFRHTQRPALKMLGVLLVGHPKTTARMVAAGLIPLLQRMMAQALNAHWSCVHLYDMVFMLRMLASNVMYRPAVFAADVMPTVCLVMLALDNNSMLQTEATTLLGYLSDNNVDTQHTVVSPDVIKLVTLAMRAHEDVVRMQMAGVRGLQCFVAKGRNVETVSKENGVNVIFRAMCNFNRNSNIAPNALSTLNFISAYGDNLARMQKAGIVRHALIAMRNHSEVLLVQSQAMLTMCNCVVPYPDMHAAFRQHDGVWLVRRAMEMPDLDSTSKQVACKILKACSG